MTDGGEYDKEITDLVRRGDRGAMKTLYCRHAGFLAAVASRYLADNDDVKDVLHDSFLKIFASVASFEDRGKGSLKRWMTRIVVNESLKFLRRKRQYAFIEPETSMAEIADDSDAADLSDIPTSEILNMIRLLPDGYRAVFNLYVIEGMTHGEIASLLGIKVSTSASQLHRAKALLVKMISKYNDQ